MKNEITLNNGIKMPKIGFGVFRMTNEDECEEAVMNAIQSGYRLIDTAAAYGNEEAVGRAIKQSNVKRDELFITTKLWITETNYELAKKGFERSLEKLGLDYLDLYLIHQPYNDYYGAWRALEELYAAGKVSAIGVDNFTQDKLADFVFWNKVKPAVNFVECNPFYQREAERTYMENKDIVMQAWSPLAAGQADFLANATLQTIAAAHEKSVAQVALRWQVQRGVVPIVKSANAQRMADNLNIFDFALTDAEMQEISKLDTGHTCFAPRQTGVAVEEFLENAKLYEL